jgi:archaellum component FlaC
MEALLEKEEQVENWNDDRLDEFSRRMDAGFDQVATKVEVSGVKGEVSGVKGEVSGVKGEVASVKGEVASVKEEMNRRFDKVDAKFNRFEVSMENQFGRLNERLDKLIFGTWAAGAAFAATAFAALVKVAFF